MTECQLEAAFYEWDDQPIIGKALDGLKGIESHSFNIESRQFIVRYDSKVTDKKTIIQAVEEVGNFNVKEWSLGD